MKGEWQEKEEEFREEKPPERRATLTHDELLQFEKESAAFIKKNNIITGGRMTGFKEDRDEKGNYIRTENYILESKDGNFEVQKKFGKDRELLMIEVRKQKTGELLYFEDRELDKQIYK
jgi:hypothetical protein